MILCHHLDDTAGGELRVKIPCISPEDDVIMNLPPAVVPFLDSAFIVHSCSKQIVPVASSQVSYNALKISAMKGKRAKVFVFGQKYPTQGLVKFS